MFELGEGGEQPRINRPSGRVVSMAAPSPVSTIRRPFSPRMGHLMELKKALAERVLNAELDDHLEDEAQLATIAILSRWRGPSRRLWRLTAGRAPALRRLRWAGAALARQAW